MMSFILSGEKLGKKYGRKTVLREASLHMRAGEVYGLVGKNGAGKTTLLRILTGLIPRFEGTVHYGFPEKPNPRIAAVITSPSLFLNMSAYDNLRLQSYQLGTRQQDEIVEALERVGLMEQRHRKAGHFSLGMTQRLKLAMTLLERPDILVLDEPINGLDPEGIAELRTLLTRLSHEGMAVLISSHILSELEQVADRFGILNQGEIVKELDKAEALQRETSLEKLYLKYTRGEGDKCYIS